ncbi:MAG TPA: GntR family transcriptional regulator, partial [Anaerolineae bacterium]|nr:GntR family transcriptional regulator [Anaerolineae bacterium]
MFTALPTEQKRSDRVAEQLEALILDNQLRTGDRLPPENELARQYGVSRTVIREAIRSLAAKGLLQVNQGSGTVVHGMTNELASRSIGNVLEQNTRRVDIAKLLEVRRLLEVEIVGIAAARRTDADI